MSSSTRFPASSSERKVEPVKLPPGCPRLLTRPAAQSKQDRNFRHLRHRARRRAARHGQVDLATPELGRHLAQRLRIADRIVQFKDEVFSLDVAARPQSLPEAVQERIGLGLRGKPEDAIESCRILCPSGSRIGQRSSDQCNEISSFHADNMEYTGFRCLEPMFRLSADNLDFDLWGSAREGRAQPTATASSQRWDTPRSATTCYHPRHSASRRRIPIWRFR